MRPSLPTLALPLLAVPLLATASPLYSFVDKQGVLHLSNLPSVSAPARVAPPHGAQGTTAALNILIEQTAARFDLDVHLLHALIQVESGYDSQARSAKGAIGLMQLMPHTAARFGANTPQDPAQNLAAGSRYLRWLVARFDGNLPLALAAYNAGEGAVAKFGNRIPPYPETADYVAKVLRHYRTRSAAPAEAPRATGRRVAVFRTDAPGMTETW